MRRSGFTLMELLIVIGIIMLLMGMLFPAFGMIKRHAMKAKCRTLIHQVDAACDLYRNVNGAYPDDEDIQNAFPLAGSPKVPPFAEDVDESTWESVSARLLLMLQTVDRSTFATMTGLLDPWKKPLHDRPAKYYRFDSGTGPSAPKHEIDGDPPPHPDTFQVWSCGVDETDDFGDSGSDDITNWK
jgi:type II secretory pathway pseudopilin PulG